MGNFLGDSSNQRKIAVALCAILALFSSKIPLLAEVKPEMLMSLLGIIAVWIHQSGGKAAAEASAEGAKAAAMIANAEDAIAVFNQLAARGKALATPVVEVKP